MTNISPVPETSGSFKTNQEELTICSKCKQKTLSHQIWESSCGGYEDVKYVCKNPECKYTYWVDGIDS